MGLETGTFVEDLVTTNPPGGDTKSQGDDHLRLIKGVLRNTFKRATKAFSFPGSVNKSANYTVLSTDDQLTFLCDTSGGAFTLTLPALVTGDAGWAIFVIKSSTDANPVFLQPASGTISGYAKVRRSIDAGMTRVTWTGGAFHATRPNGGVIGQSIPYHGSTLPNGHLWADGSTPNATNYPELAAVVPTLPDLRGRVLIGRDDMGGSAAGRITNAASGITGTTLGASGGTQTHTLTAAQIATHGHTASSGNQSADHTHSGTTGAGSAHQHSAFIGDDGHFHGYLKPGPNLVASTGAGQVLSSTPANTDPANTGVRVRSTAGTAASADDKTATESAHTHPFTSGGISASHNHTITVNNSTGGDQPHLNVQPSLVCNYIIVAE